MEFPNKIKHFLWRIAHNSYLLRANLAYRGMDVESHCHCVVCSNEIEDGGHLYFKCPAVHHFWAELGAEEHIRERLAKIDCASDAVSISCVEVCVWGR